MDQERERSYEEKEFHRRPVLSPADILLPAEGIDMEKWAVIACDQFTSQPEYWERVEAEVGGAPSSLRMIYPEVYLAGEGRSEYQERIRRIHRQMERYLRDGILREQVRQGYVLTVRRTDAGLRIGLVGALDLEAYDYRPEKKAPVRATEETIRERIPVRVGIRKGALLESTHVMLLLDDGKRRFLEALYESRDRFPKLYDVELMLGGGHATGYALEGAAAEAVSEYFIRLAAGGREILLAVGDGNHSLAAAKACWESAKGTLSAEESRTHPARYALAEVVNLHSPALEVHPIHRILYGGDLEALANGFRAYLSSRGMESDLFFLKEEKVEAEKREASGRELPARSEILFLQGNVRAKLCLTETKGHLPAELLQKYLDRCLKEQERSKGEGRLRLDYIHDPEAAESLAGKQGACAMLMGAIGKSDLFPAVAAGGVLPRKTFSIGTDVQKRYYIECRRLGGKAWQSRRPGGSFRYRHPEFARNRLKAR